MAMKFHFTIRPFTLQDTSFLKGVAILLIILHNFYRWVTPITGENEFWFNPSFITRSWIFLRTDPLEFFHIFFNFLGHYGVQAFIVISAYGLTISYQRSRPRYGQFVLHRFNRLYPSLILAGIGFIIITLITTGELIGKSLLADLGIQFTLFANLIPGKAMVISGPWWFYSFIFQFYLIFPLLLWIYRKTGWMGLAGITVIGYLFTILLYTPMTLADLNPYMTFMGHLPEFCLGIFLATRQEVKLPWWVFLLALLVFIGGNIYRWLWPFANLGAAVLLVVAIRGMTGNKVRMKHLYSLISAIGMISIYLFAVHGYLRSRFINLANDLGDPIASILVAILFVAVVCGVAFLLMQTEAAARKWISSTGNRTASLTRLLVLVILVVGGFALLFFWNLRNQYNGEIRTEEVLVVDSSHQFEGPIPGKWYRFSDSIVHRGNGSVVLPGAGTFSPGFQVDFNTIDLDGVDEVDFAAWFYSNDPGANVHLVMEILDRPTGRQVEWQSEFIRGRTFNPGTWFQRKLLYQLKPEFRKPNYSLKLYGWNPSEGTWYIDDMTFRLKAKRKPVIRSY